MKTLFQHFLDLFKKKETTPTVHFPEMTQGEFDFKPTVTGTLTTGKLVEVTVPIENSKRKRRKGDSQ